MSDRFLPTEQESAKVARILSWRSWLPLAIIVPLVVIGLGRLVPERNDWIVIALAVSSVAGLLAVAVYVSFFLRCPRCETWVGVVVPKCASCGLKFEVQKGAPTTGARR